MIIVTVEHMIICTTEDPIECKVMSMRDMVHHSITHPEEVEVVMEVMEVKKVEEDTDDTEDGDEDVDEDR